VQLGVPDKSVFRWSSIGLFAWLVVISATGSWCNTFDQLWDDWSFPLHTGDFGGTTTRVL